MTAPNGSAELRSAAEALKARVDAWVSAVEQVGATADDGADALEDPRLDAAEDEFEEAVMEFHRACGPVLGLDPHDEDDEDDASLEVEELALHFEVGVLEGGPDPARDAGTLVHEAGERLAGQLMAAGYHVPRWCFGCPTELFLDDDEDVDDEDVDDDIDDEEDEA